MTTGGTGKVSWCWAKCPDCGGKEKVRRVVFERRNRPRCGGCGGFLQPSEDAKGVMAGARETRRDLPENRDRLH